MRLELGGPVRCTDGPCGELADVVVDPVRRRVTHLVVAPHRRHGAARLVPVSLAGTADEDPGAIALRCTSQELGRFDNVEDFAYVRLDDVPLSDPDWDVGIEEVLAQPFYEGSEFAAAMDVDPHVSLTYDRIPKGEAEIRRESDVVSADGHLLGQVDGFVVDGDDDLTHVVIECGHLFGRRDVTIPIDAVGRVKTDEISLTLTKEEVERLPGVPVHGWNLLARGRTHDVDEH